MQSILVTVEARNLKSILQLGILRENNVLYFVIGKRFQHQTPFLNLDSVRVTTAIDRFRTTQGKKRTKSSFFSIGEFLRAVFDDFVDNSPFKGYVNESVSLRELSVLTARFNKEAEKILNLE
jgi:hypothetical protein